MYGSALKYSRQRVKENFENGKSSKKENISKEKIRPSLR